MPAELSLWIVIVAAALDSINPCVFGVLIFLLAYMLAVFKSKARMIFAGLIYITFVYITYFLLGVGIFTLAYTAGISKYFYWGAAIIAIGAGLLEIKDFFWYGKGFSLTMIPGASERIKKYTKLMGKLETKHPVLSLVVAAVLGIFVVLVELPCTGAPYLAILGMLSSGNYANGIPLLLLYNLVFIFPLFIIMAIAYMGFASKSLEKWRKENRGMMRLAVGLLLIFLGSYMIWSVI